MTIYEQEVVINLNAEEEAATVYCADPRWIRKMDKLVEAFPDTFRLTRQTKISRTYELPKRFVRIGKPGEPSLAEREFEKSPAESFQKSQVCGGAALKG